MRHFTYHSDVVVWQYIFESGAATNYITRGRALKKLQLSLKDFRRLCILKGVYPHEPLHKKKVNKGSTENRVYYYAKDINFLASEPIIRKFREYKIFLRKLTTAKAKRDEERIKTLYENRPEYQLDHIVKERYPTFESALRDLDDALCLLFAFAVLPHTKIITSSLVASSRRLTAEFNHYIIESNSLNKVFVSIKGIYYEAEVMGERVTWIVGHDRGMGHVSEVDFSVMATFAEFYVTMLEFVNFRLYQSVGLFYPPKLAFKSDKLEDDDQAEEGRVYSLACPLSKFENYEEQIDASIGDEVDNVLNEKLCDVEKRKQLFANYRFWLNREVPKDVLAIIIRSCGGLVSWENCPAAQYYENDAQITHQIVDRPLLDSHKNISRCYVQPQWVFDSFNRRSCLSIKKYLPGAILPPHLSPFSSDYDTYEEQLNQLRLLSKASANVTNRMETEAENKVQERKKIQKEKEVPIINVNKGRMHKENLQKKLNEKGHELKLREMLIPKKRRRVYSKIKRGIKRRVHEEKKLNEKRLKMLKAAD
uniref:Pescadillo homolog n=1 Tax=Brugia malayi TaxID=6279 RepID=PESC_BRUMA|nr:RecName: Full=Pescadillo homolog [Brugia malayi]